MRIAQFLASIVVSLLAACAGDRAVDRVTSGLPPTVHGEGQVATFGAGCFWCAEACFEQLDGVLDVQSGFMGGADLPVATDAHALVAAGHAEVVQIRFDAGQVSYATLLSWFWVVHDPTSLDRQGEDEGP